MMSLEDKFQVPLSVTAHHIIFALNPAFIKCQMFAADYQFCSVYVTHKQTPRFHKVETPDALEIRAPMRRIGRTVKAFRTFTRSLGYCPSQIANLNELPIV